MLIRSVHFNLTKESQPNVIMDLFHLVKKFSLELKSVSGPDMLQCIYNLLP